MTFKSDMAEFRKHARAMKKAGFLHVSVKSGLFEAHVEGVPGTDTEAVGHPIGFHSESGNEETEEDD